MKNRRSRFTWLAIPLIVLIVGAAGLLVWKSLTEVKEMTIEVSSRQTAVVKPVDGRASFSVFTNGDLRVFTDSKYHNQSPDVFITAEANNIVNIKKNGVTWQQFFDSLPAPMRVTSECLYTGTGQVFCNRNAKSLKFYKNGKLVINLLQQSIVDGDKVLISYGNINAEVLNELSKVPNPR